MMESDSLSEISAGSGEEDGLLARTPKLSCADWVMTCNLFKGSWQSNAMQDPHIEVMLAALSKRCHTLSRDDARRRYANEKQKVERELKSISQTLSAGLLQHVLRVFSNAYFEHQYSRTLQPSDIEYDRQLDIPSTIKEVEVLQAKLDATVDEDEQRALEEDVTGKILWLCWCGICAEVDQLLPKIVGYIRRESNMKGLGEIAFTGRSTGPGDDQAHLRRIMLDAGTSTSKHHLWLVARAAEQAKWSGATRVTTAMDNQGSTASTSTQPLSTSVV
ncbi:hypothetical protein BKA82DRAFT_1008740 [Pisolithus tinctorius]|uniref:Uncharacterized protein n=1 Tax=Pisolithus tinctorius Marx 270 TaxID=870435 RepID=A0A0C3J7W3_PISTI|nr:hypothetical protein BKA82DRAFT_1008740 [Pisolithus tinctorius]KIN93766.1 hypothetical protein M404DRAFT_1008740 [Pisolithus tinctorius Marx 270]